MDDPSFGMTSLTASLRPAEPADWEFLFRVYASTRAEELSLVPWSEEQREGFLRAQFSAQDRCYRENYPGAEFCIILVDDLPAGRLYLHRRADELRIMDVALLPEYQRQGIGTCLLRRILDQAVANQIRVTIHVEIFNPARGLYERLGFAKRTTHGVYDLMEANPAKVAEPVS